MTRLAAAASQPAQHDAVLEHVTECAGCALLFDEQREVRATLRTMTTPPLGRARRDALAADLLAAADERRAGGGRRVTLAFAIPIAAAAAVAIIALSAALAPTPPAPSNRVAGASPPVAPSSASRSPIAGTGSSAVNAAAAVVPERHHAPARRPDAAHALGDVEPLPSAQITGDAQFARGASEPDRDIVELRSGALTVDAVATRPMNVVAGDTIVGVTRARVAVTARDGVVSMVQVFAGSAEVVIDGHREVVSQGTVWQRDAGRDDALAAFRTGWTALRAGDHQRAIAAFDRATHPVVAEDAAFWAAVACDRAGDHREAARRFTEFIARYPLSPRVEAARAALARQSR